MHAPTFLSARVYILDFRMVESQAAQMTCTAEIPTVNVALLPLKGTYFFVFAGTFYVAIKSGSNILFKQLLTFVLV